jgi:hypothetical protein
MERGIPVLTCTQSGSPQDLQTAVHQTLPDPERRGQRSVKLLADLYRKKIHLNGLSADSGLNREPGLITNLDYVIHTSDSTGLRSAGDALGVNGWGCSSLCD